jgi:RLL motif-containing protein 1
MLTVQSEEFKVGVNALAKLLDVTCHPDHLVTLKAVSQVVAARLTPEALEKPDTVIIKVIFGESFLRCMYSF